MQNFNTNQTRHFYVVGAVKRVAPESKLDITPNITDTGELFFSYKNNDGIVTRTDTINIKKVVSVKKATAAKMAKPILAHKITIAADVVANLSNLIGKVFALTVNIHQYGDYDEASSRAFVATVIGDSTNTASAAAFYKALAVAIAKALPTPDAYYPLLKVFAPAEVTKSTKVSDISGTPAAVYLVPGLQKYVRGKLTADPCPLSVASRLHDGDDTVWAEDEAKTVAKFNTADSVSLSPVVVPAVYTIADLEYFALGERGDVYRGFNFPNDYPINPAIDLTQSYDMLSVEYYWSGDAENVQKSPRLMEFAGPAAVITTLESKVTGAIEDGEIPSTT